MIKDDYSAKVSDQFNSLIKEIRNINNLHTEKLSLINTSLKKFIGISSIMINSMSESDVLNLMKRNGSFDANYCIIAAALLYEEAIIFDKKDEYLKAYSKYSKAFYLILKIKSLNLECEIVGYQDIMKNVSSALENFHLPFNIRKDLITYHELSGEYSKAEDNIYDLLENPDTHSFAKEKLKEFYNNLLLKDDLTLEKGNLPRGEILEALEKI
ncbi:DUF6483 family protein [Clostridium akagii]|uniref:DUF6483 family protein n=1 Tax=Clostridium akagii TaxID=91623 RepID=UPI00047B3D9B|nr:DUF6483 family protein [Clostridium akagii]